MESIPLRIMVESDAKEVAHHTPIPVALYFQGKTLSDIKWNIQLGVLEELPISDPVTWCQCTKKDGTPRRTVDFQALNAHAKCQTQNPTYHPHFIRHGPVPIS